MCLPLVPLAIMAAASAAQQAAQYKAQGDQAESAAKFQNKQYGQVAGIAMQNYLHTVNTTQFRMQQDTAATSQQATQNADAGQAAQATAVTSAAEGGVQGNSVAQLLNDFSFHEAANNAVIHQNLQWDQLQADEELKSAQTGTSGNISSATPRPVPGPSAVGLGLGLAADALQTFDAYQYRTMRGPYNANNKNQI